jgi:tRNA A37 threonylcarbamoyladenosine dehydratase
LLLGEDAMERLSRSHVAVVGLGGVGGAAAEMLARAGVGTLTLIDSDTVSDTNRNRQLCALSSTVGAFKTEVVSARLRDINPDIRLHLLREFLCEENVAALLPPTLDYVVDAIDTLSPKIALIQHCLKTGIPLVSSMGSGAKRDATAVRIADISRTRQCPLAHMLRKRLHKLGIREGFKAVYSEEVPLESAVVMEEGRNKKSNVGTLSYLPTVFGCVCAQAVLDEL